MKSRSSIKREKISHLQWCLDNLMLKENQSNTEAIELLYRNIYEIISTMQDLEDVAALDYFRKEVSARRIRELLKHYNIDLAV